jgi:hypothetical protein
LLPDIGWQNRRRDGRLAGGGRFQGGGRDGWRGSGRFFLAGAVAGVDDNAGLFPGLDEAGAGLGVGELEDEVVEIAEVSEEGTSNIERSTLNIEGGRNWIFQSSQFSNRKPGTWAKSTVLRVRSVASWVMAMQAIFRSMVPMRSRCF